MHPCLKQFQELARTKSADTQSHGCEKGCTKPQSGPKRGAGCSLAQGMSWHIFGTSLAHVSSVANNSREICQIRQIVLCRAVSRETRETRETPGIAAEWRVSTICTRQVSGESQGGKMWEVHGTGLDSLDLQEAL